ncbi:hypothetical protein [Aquirhabdus sp.]|uniref:hypothetical protein n=1 Tax=Aquirhabdus sp. TaxID=2824160 RepID=UPI00396CBA1A
MKNATPLKTIPTCSSMGVLILSTEHDAEATQLKSNILSSGGYVERQAICTVQIHPDMTCLSYVISDYAAIKTLRKHRMILAAIGSGTLLCCPERQQVILQRRSSLVDTYPHKLSAFGGHFSPDRDSLGHGALIDTLIAELQEEAGIDLLTLSANFVDDLPPIYMIHEPDTGAIQFTPLAFALTPDQADRVIGSEEGAIEVFHLVEDVETLMDDSQWSQMGFTCFQTWREQGFPVQKNWVGPTI